MKVEIEKLVFGGQGMARLPSLGAQTTSGQGHIDGKIAFVWNALPGETVEIDVIQNRKTHLEGVAKTSPSASRAAL